MTAISLPLVGGETVEVDSPRMAALVGAAVAVAGRAMVDAAYAFHHAEWPLQQQAVQAHPAAPWRSFLTAEAAALLAALEGMGLRPKVRLPSLRPAPASVARPGGSQLPAGCGGDPWDGGGTA